MALSNKERQQKHREQLKAKGLTTVTLTVHPSQIPELQKAAELLRANPAMDVAMLRSYATGRFKKI